MFVCAELLCCSPQSNLLALHRNRKNCWLQHCDKHALGCFEDNAIVKVWLLLVQKSCLCLLWPPHWQRRDDTGMAPYPARTHTYCWIVTPVNAVRACIAICKLPIILSAQHASLSRAVRSYFISTRLSECAFQCCGSLWSVRMFIKANLSRSINGFKKKMNQAIRVSFEVFLLRHISQSAVPHSLPPCFHTSQGGVFLRLCWGSNFLKILVGKWGLERRLGLWLWYTNRKEKKGRIHRHLS